MGLASISHYATIAHLTFSQQLDVSNRAAPRGQKEQMKT